MIHPSALVHPEAKVHPEAEIGPWCTVGPRVTIGKGTRLVSHVVVDGWTTLGERNTVFPFAVIGVVPQDLKYKGEATRVEIGNGNTIREMATIHLGTQGGGGVTKVGDGCLLMAYVHLGHDCLVGNQVIVANYSGLAGHVTIEDYANIAGQTGISQFVRVGTHAYIGGQAGLERDVPPFCIAMGARPAQVRGANIVGMRRKGFAAETITKINEAIKLWTRPEVPKERCLLEIESQFGDAAEIQQFLKFIRESETGVTR